MTIAELFAEQKKQDARKNLIGTLKFGAVAMPLLMVYAAPPYFRAYTQIPIYHADCRSALTVNTVQSSGPCHYETATGQLKNYYSGRTARLDSQDVLLSFPDGRTAKVEIDHEPGTHWTHSQVDGLCSVEVWHGQTTAVLRPGARILLQHNPELEGGTTAVIVAVLGPGTLSLVCWTYLFALWKRGDLAVDGKGAV